MVVDTVAGNIVGVVVSSPIEAVAMVPARAPVLTEAMMGRLVYPTPPGMVLVDMLGPLTAVPAVTEALLEPTVI